MSSSNSCPAHLLARLQVLQAHLVHLAARLGQETSFAEEIATATEGARRAQAERSTILVESAIQQHRELARQLYEAANAGSQAAPEALAPRDATFPRADRA